MKMLNYIFLLLVVRSALCMEKPESVTLLLPDELQSLVFSKYDWAANLKESLKELKHLRMVCKQWNRLLHQPMPHQQMLFPLVNAYLQNRGKTLSSPFVPVAPHPRLMQAIYQVGYFFSCILSLENVDIPVKVLRKNLYEWIENVFTYGSTALSPLEIPLTRYALSLISLDVSSIQKEQAVFLAEFLSLILFLKDTTFVGEFSIDLLSHLKQSHVKVELLSLLKKRVFPKKIPGLINALLADEKSEKLAPECFDQALEQAGVSLSRMPSEKELEDSLSRLIFSDDERAFLKDVRGGNHDAVKGKRELFSQPMQHLAFLCSLCWQQENCAAVLFNRANFMQSFSKSSLAYLVFLSSIERNVQFLEELIRLNPKLAKQAACCSSTMDALRRVYQVTDPAGPLNDMLLCYTVAPANIEQHVVQHLEVVSNTRIRDIFNVFCATGNLEGMKLLLFDPRISKEHRTNSWIIPERYEDEILTRIIEFLRFAFNKKQYHVLEYFVNSRLIDEHLERARSLASDTSDVWI